MTRFAMAAAALAYSNAPVVATSSCCGVWFGREGTGGSGRTVDSSASETRLHRDLRRRAKLAVHNEHGG